jgi:hypothetical protein
MGYRGKLMVQHTGIELPIDFVEKHKKLYYIGSGLEGSDKENTFYVNISSKCERKEHYKILSDLQDLLKGSFSSVYAVILWEDGAIYRYNLSSGEQETFNLDD